MVGRGRGRGRGSLENQQTEIAEMRRMIEDLTRAVQAHQGQERRGAPRRMNRMLTTLFMMLLEMENAKIATDWKSGWFVPWISVVKRDIVLSTTLVISPLSLIFHLLRNYFQKKKK